MDNIVKLAIPTGEVVDGSTMGLDDELANQLFFNMKIEEKEFLLALTDFLEILVYAQEEGALPQFPVNWWIRVKEMYDLPFIQIVD